MWAGSNTKKLQQRFRDINHIYFQSCSFYDHSLNKIYLPNNWKIMCLYLDLSWDSICGEVITSQGSAPLIKQTDSNYTREIKVYRPNRDKFNDHSKFYGTISIIKVVLDVDIYDGAHFFQNLSNSWKEILNADLFYTFIQYKWVRIKLYLFSCLGI